MNDRQCVVFARQVIVERKRRAKLADAVAAVNREFENELDEIRRECAEIGHEWVFLFWTGRAATHGCAICCAQKVEE